MFSWEHQPLYLSGTGRDFPDTAISGSCQQALVGIHNSVLVWWLYVGWIPGGAVSECPFLQSLLHNLFLCLSYNGYFSTLRRTKLSTLWSSSSWDWFVLWIIHWLLLASDLISTYEWVHTMCVLYDWVTTLRMIFSISFHLPKNFMNSLFLITE